MKTLQLIFFILAFVNPVLHAQYKNGYRKLTTAEIKYCNDLHAALITAMPQTYSNWAINDYGKDFDIQTMWHRDQLFYGDCPLEYGRTGPYSVDVDYKFTAANGAIQTNTLTAYKKITDFNSSTQIATALRAAAVGKLAIRVSANVIAGRDCILSYCRKAPLANIPLPVPTTLAVMGIHSDLCPIRLLGKTDMSGDYYDNAIIILGKPVIRKLSTNKNNGLTYTTYYAGFDKLKMNQLITQNIVVTIKGNSADIDAVTKLINWQKLYSLIGK